MRRVSPILSFPAPLARTARRCAAVLATALAALHGPVAPAAERAVLPASTLPAAEAGEDGAGRVIVRFRSARAASALGARGAGEGIAPGVALAELRQARALGERTGLALRDGPGIAPDMQVVTLPGMDSATLARRLAADADVLVAVPDGRRRAHAVSDPLWAGGAGISPASGQWYLRAPTTAIRSSIDAEGAWAVTTGRADVVVAILDSGVRMNHPDLEGKLLPGHDFIATEVVANDGDGRDDNPSDPGDWITADENSNSRTFRGCGVGDSSWHGTKTSGLVAAATHNGAGMAGIGRHVRVLPVRVLGKCGGYDSDIIAAMRWSAGLAVPGVPINPYPARVVNMSLGFTGACASTDPYAVAVAELRQLGVVVVSSAGNDSRSVNKPANCPGVIAVAGLRHAGTKNGFSSLGPEVAVAAPAGNCVNETGECLYPMLTTSNDGTTAPGCPTYTTGGQDASYGTSFSAPLVSGTIALMLSAQPSLTPDQVLALLRSTARAFPAAGTAPDVATCVAGSTVAQDECHCTSGTCGAGMLDAGAAVRAAAAGTTVARLGDSASRIPAGGTITLDARGSVAATGRTLVGYRWRLTDGSALAGFVGATDGPTAVLSAATGAAGPVRVELDVTDSAGTVTRSAAVLRAGAPTSAVCGYDATDDAGGEGGGAVGAGWLAGLGLAVAALAAADRRRRRVRRPA